MIKETHDRISKIEAYPFSKDNFQLPAPNAFLRSLTLRHMLAFAQNIPGGRLDFLDETVEINRSLMKKGLERKSRRLFGSSGFRRGPSATGSRRGFVGAHGGSAPAGRNGNRLRESGHNIVAYNRRRGSFFQLYQRTNAAGFGSGPFG